MKVRGALLHGKLGHFSFWVCLFGVTLRFLIFQGLRERTGKNLRFWSPKAKGHSNLLYFRLQYYYCFRVFMVFQDKKWIKFEQKLAKKRLKNPKPHFRCRK